MSNVKVIFGECIMSLKEGKGVGFCVMYDWLLVIYCRLFWLF